MVGQTPLAVFFSLQGQEDHGPEFICITAGEAYKEGVPAEKQEQLRTQNSHLAVLAIEVAGGEACPKQRVRMRTQHRAK